MSDMATTTALQEWYVEAPPPQILISETRLELWVTQNWRKMGAKYSWIQPLSILVPFLFSRVTSTYKITFGIEASVWKFVSTLLLIFLIFWLGCSIYRSLRSKGCKEIIRNLKDDMIRSVEIVDPTKS